jgi:hypothetical protein
MLFTELNDNLTDFILTFCGIIDTPANVMAARALSKILPDTRTDAQKLLWNQINQVVINVAENGPRPVPPYISTHLQLVQRKGFVPYRSQAALIDPTHPGLGINQLIYYIEEAHLYLQAYGFGSNNYLQNIQQALVKQAGTDFLDSYSIAFLYDSAIRDIHILIDATYEERFSYDLCFSIGQEIIDNMGIIETVDQTGTIIPPE